MNTLTFTRVIRGVLLLAVFVPLPNTGLAQNTQLADGPLAAESHVPPTIMMTADDSSSMTWYFTPENIDDIGNACLENPLPRKCKVFRFDDGTTDPIVNTDSSALRNRVFFQYGQPPLLAAAFNKLAYNPLIDYEPPIGYNNITDFENVEWSGGGWAGNWHGRPYKVNLKDHYEYQKSTYENIMSLYGIGTPSGGNSLSNYINNGSYRLPPHYYKTKVRWCDASNDCIEERDNTHPTPKYEPADGSIHKFELIILDYANPNNNPLTFTHQYHNPVTGITETKTRSRNEELTNYANWAAYYRNRLAATKTAASLAFDSICDPSETICGTTPYIGFATINKLAGHVVPTGANWNTPASTLNPDSFTGAHRNDFLKRLLDFPWTWGGTPLVKASNKVGQLFQANASGQYIRASCQRNYNILFTDGLWNDGAYNDPAVTIGDQDHTLLNALPENGVTVYGHHLSQGNLWPPPIGGNASNQSNLLADVALYYWMKDLQPAKPNDVETTLRDPATWQHLNFIGMGFGVKGTLPSANQEETLAKITNGNLNWPTIVTGTDHYTKVDDLWHASVNGFGRFVAADSPAEFKSGLRSILNEILNLGGARSGVAITGRNLVTNDHYTFAPSFLPGWGGDITKKGIRDTGAGFHVDETGGELISITQTAQKSAAEKLTARPYNEREIFTVNSDTHNSVDFLRLNLAPTQLDTLNPLALSGGTLNTWLDAVIAYLRGDRSNEGVSLGKFRERVSPLGDIVNAKPVIVAKPACWEDATIGGNNTLRCDYGDYGDPDNPDDNRLDDPDPSYKEFYETKKNRKVMVYVGANDGMLHAFDDNLNEKWAYIPSDLFRPRAKGGIINLIYQVSNEDIPFKHYFYVDATPRVFDAKLENGWRTILIGGLGKGGTSYYAFEVTEGAVGSGKTKLLWEFTDDHMGYTYGKPIITMTKAWRKSDGDYKWVAILPSGYNNGKGTGSAKDKGNGKAYLFFVDLENGDELHRIEVDEGNESNPSNLAYIAGYVEDYRFQMTTAVYGADEHGNFWRFNLEDEDPNNWVPEKLGVLKDKKGDPQYVTTEPVLMLMGEENTIRWAAIGTGGFRHTNDLISSSPDNTFYVFRDGNVEHVGTNTDIRRTDMVEVKENDAKPELDPLPQYGWYMDMDAGYHINVQPEALFGFVVYAANKYTAGTGNFVNVQQMCERTSGFTGKLFVREAAWANSRLLDKNSPPPYITISRGIADAGFVRYRKDEETSFGVTVSGYDGELINDGPIDIPIDSSAGGSAALKRADIRYILK